MQKHINRFFITLGIIGAICFSISAVPEVIHTIRTNEVGVTDGTLLLWFTGELCSLAYVLYKDRDKIQLANYAFNLLCISFLMYVRYGG